MRRYYYNQPAVLKDYEEGFGLEIPRRYDANVSLGDLVENYEWQVTYKFSSDIRENHFSKGNYGGDNISYRRLYEILVHKFNKDRYFLDDYFETCFPYSYAKEEADKLLERLKIDMVAEYTSLLSNVRITKEGKIDRRYTVGIRRLSEFKALSKDYLRSAGERIAFLTREDIVRSLRLGIIPLRKKELSELTMKRRNKLGFTLDDIFYASGRFIQDIHVYFRLEKKKWINQDF